MFSVQCMCMVQFSRSSVISHKCVSHRSSSHRQGAVHVRVRSLLVVAQVVRGPVLVHSSSHWLGTVHRQGAVHVRVRSLLVVAQVVRGPVLVHSSSHWLGTVHVWVTSPLVVVWVRHWQKERSELMTDMTTGMEQLHRRYWFRKLVSV